MESIKSDREYRNFLRLYADLRLEVLAKYNALASTVPQEQIQVAVSPDLCKALSIEDRLRDYEKQRGL